MAQQSLTPIGLDLSPQMGRLAHRRLAREGLPTRLVRARSQALPFPDGSFPDIVATFPTAYIVDPCTLRELGRVLTGEGRAVVLASMRLTGKGILSRLLEWLYRVTGQRDPGISQPLDALSGSGLSFQAEWVTVERGEILLLTGGHRSQ
jgi:ubiquinone/menaquinone biosynthesis C-methylase UbiE